MSAARLAEQIVEAAQLLFTAGVMSHSGHANLSARVSDTSFLLTTSGSVRHLDASQLATVSTDGAVLDGSLAAENAEIVSMHAVVYAVRPDLGAIIHTHSPSATAFALAHRELPCRTEPLLRFGQVEPVPVVAWGPRGSNVSVRGIASVLDAAPTTNAALLANHGLLVFGADPLAAARLLIAVEESAEAELAATAIGGGVDFPEGALDAVRASIARAGT
jgi:L-ribulose-5-phosphate 4-epimerase